MNSFSLFHSSVEANALHLSFSASKQHGQTSSLLNPNDSVPSYSQLGSSSLL